MKYLDEYRDADAAARYVDAIAGMVTRPWPIMEVCGGQTHSIIRFGLDEILPSEITLIHGPGCPVCVTPVEILDKAIAIAALPEVVTRDSRIKKYHEYYRRFRRESPVIASYESALTLRHRLSSIKRSGSRNIWAQ